MMKVLGGEFRGQKLELPKVLETRPVSNRIREAIFNILGDIDDLEAADLYAGSGSLAIESLSRGASSAAAVEWDGSAAAVIESNARRLGIESRLTVEKEDVKRWLLEQEYTCDIVFADPPFAGIDPEIIRRLPQVMSPGATLIFRYPRRQEAPDIPGLRPVKHKRYGASAVTFYQA